MGLFARAHRRATLAFLVTISVVAGFLTVGATSAAAIGPSIAVSQQVSSSVLVGQDASFTLTASNPGIALAVPQYNATFRTVLPAGVTYKVASTSPSSAGEPTIIRDALTGQQTLIWSNVADVQVGSTFALSFKATPDPATLSVGWSFDSVGEAYASSDPKLVPKFDTQGVAIANAAVSSAQTAPATTQVTAITVAKSEPSPEGELLRGVHTHSTIYTLKVTNNDKNATNAVVVEDYIPAGMEFLGCGGVDNSTGVEYPGAPSLTSTPTIASASCPTPTRVETVTNPPAQGAITYPAGIYTKVTWSLGNLAAGAIKTIQYRAGIPLKANTATFTGGTPTATSLTQTANLNNNSGPSVRETATEKSLTNIVRVSGTYTGPVAPSASTSVSSSGSSTVTAEDISMQKSVSPSSFTAGGIATFTLTVRVSEYVNGSAITLTDTLPDGMCPLSSSVNYSTGSVSDCAPVAGSNPTGASYSSITQQPDGTFAITFNDLTVNADGVAVVTFKARMLANYLSNGDPVVAGDAVVNNAALTGTTTPIAGTGESGTETVSDISSARLTTSSLTVVKKIKPAADPYVCGTGPYVKPTDPGYSSSDFIFAKGSRICFELSVTFPSSTDSRNVVINDVLPDGTVYEAGSQSTVVAPSYAVTFNEAAAAADTAFPTWTLGNTIGAAKFVPAGGTFKAYIGAIVQRAADETSVDLTDNLMKMRSESTSGAAVSYRDSVGFGIAPVTPLTITKGIAEITDTVGAVASIDPVPGAANNVDDKAVEQGDQVQFRVDLKNAGTDANGNAEPIRGFDVWDVLAPGITCAQVSSISAVSAAAGAPIGVCTNPGDATHPTFTDNATLSAIRWTARSGTQDQILPGASRTMTYEVAIPTPSRAGADLVDTAHVRSYDVFNEQSDTSTTYYPLSNVDTTVAVQDQLIPAIFDPSNVFLVDVFLKKAVIATGITDSNNSALTEAVNGETVTYRISFTVPARTSIYNGAIAEVLPSGIQFISASARFAANGNSPATSALPSGVSLNASNGGLSFPTTYTNNSSTDDLFEVTVVGKATANASTGVKTNSALYGSRATPNGAALPNKTATATVTVIRPSPSLAKTNSSTGTVVGGQVIKYQLRASNTSGRPTLYDGIIVDCVPAGVIFQSYDVPTAGTTKPAVAGTGANGCPAGTTKLTWNPGPIAGGIARTLSYNVKVTEGAVGNVQYTNNATLEGSGLNDGANNPSVEYVVSKTATNTVTVNGVTIGKTVVPAARTIGQIATFTATVTVPANVNFYNLSIVDRIPAGFDRTTLTTDAVDCTNADGGDCDLTPNELTPVAQLDGSTTAGWLLGDATASTQRRTIKVTYSIEVKDLAGIVRNSTLINSAEAKWDVVTGPAPISPDYAFTQKTPTPATATVTVQEPSLTVDKRVDDSTPSPGQLFTYTVKVSNSTAVNTSTAYNASVTDTIPVGVVIQIPLPTGAVLTGAGPNGGGTITWTPTTNILTGGFVTLTYRALLADSTTLTSAPLTNTADITQYRSQPNRGRLYDGPSDPATVTPAFPVLSVTKSAPEGTLAYIDDEFRWSIEVQNTGKSGAFDVDVTDALPPNWRYVANSAWVSVANAPSTAVEPVTSLSGDVQTLTFSNVGDLAVGESIIVRLTAKPLPAVVSAPGVGGSISHTNNAAAAANDATGNDRNADGPYTDSDTANAHIDSADVQIVKTHTGPVVAGSSFDWNLEVTNNGPDTAVGPFVVSDEVPVGPTLVTASGTGWSCDIAGRVITCQSLDGDATLASGASFPLIKVTMRVGSAVAESTTYSNTASVTDRTYDPDQSNNTSSDDVTVTTSADLQIVKRLTGTIVAGRNATYTLDVNNLGPSVSRGAITVTDSVPDGTTFVSATGSGWICAESGGVITCDHAADLPTDSSAGQITVVVLVDSGRATDVVNSASVTGPTTDPDSSNNTDDVTTTPDTSADLILTKSSIGSVVAGTTATYRLVAKNVGPSDAQSVTITDTLPASGTYSSFSSVSGSWTCNESAGAVTCDLGGSLASGATAEVTINVDISPSVVGNIANTAVVDSTTPDPNPNNTDGTDNSEFTGEADLAIVKSHSGNAIAGENISFTLAVTNGGPSDAAADIVVKDSLPAGLTFVSASGSGWVCTHSGADITCTRSATLATGGTASDITVVAAVDPSAGPDTVFNTATVESTTTDDPNMENNTSTDDLIVNDSTDISIAKSTTGANPVRAGSRTEFSIVVTNHGPSTADDVIVTDTLPLGFSDISLTENGWTCEPIVGNRVVCRLAELVPGTSPTLKISAQVTSDVNGGSTLTNSAAVTTNTPDDDPSNNSDDSTVDVSAAADLVLTKTAPTERIEAGESGVYTLAVSNNGPSNASADIVVVDTLPVNLTYASNNGPWDCVPSAVTGAGQVVTCTLQDAQGVPAGGDAPNLEMLVDFNADADAGDYTNTASVSSPTDDPDTSNNDDSAGVTIGRQVDLVTTKLHTGDVKVGENVIFTIRVTNKGPSQAREIVSTDTLPTGLEFVEANGDGDWNCDESGGTVTCALTTPLEPLAYTEYTVTAKVLASAYPSVTNTATAESDIPDDFQPDNTADDVVSVPALVDLKIAKSHTGNFTTGSTGTYTVTVTNAGPTSDPGPLTVTDTLPNGLTYISGTGTGWSCSSVGQAITCVHAAALAKGASARLTIKVNVLPAAAPGVTNTASVSSESADVDPSNNADSDPTTVDEVSSLAIAKEALSYKGTTAVYRIKVTNNGPSVTTTQVIIRDYLPAELTYVSSAGIYWACGAVGQTVTCTNNQPLAVGRTISVNITTSVKVGASGTIVNVADVTGGNVDNDSSVTVSDDAQIIVPKPLAETGAGALGMLIAGLALIGVGAAMQRVRRPQAVRN